MWTIRACVFPVALVALAVPAIGQSVISTHSGVIYYFDGTAYLDNQPIQPRMGKFQMVPQGSELRTAQGHAEVLLTPGVFLRMGRQTAIHMMSNDLANTRVVIESGSAIVDSGEPNAGTSVTLLFKNWQISSSKAGSYRIDSDPARLWVFQGQAEVNAGNQGEPVKVEEGMDLPFAAVLVPEQASAEPTDDLSEWAKGRSDSIVADNTITRQIGSDPDSQTPDPDGFSYFPIIGVPPVSYSSPYSTIAPGQPGFYSMYLPGYTSLPVLLAIMGSSTPRTTSRVPLLPLHIGVGVGVGGFVGSHPLIPGLVPVPLVPLHPVARPAVPIAHPAVPATHPVIMHPMIHR